MRVRLLPLDDLAEFGKTDRVAILLTIGRDEAREIMDELSAAPEQLMFNAMKLYELLQVIAEPDLYQRYRALTILNTEGRHGGPGCGVTGAKRPGPN